MLPTTQWFRWCSPFQTKTQRLETTCQSNQDTLRRSSQTGLRLRSVWGQSPRSSPQAMGQVWGHSGLPALLLHIRRQCFLLSLSLLLLLGSPPTLPGHPSAFLGLSLSGLLQAHCQNGESKSAEVIGCRRPWKVLCLLWKWQLSF